jgi:hypothetical protein
VATATLLIPCGTVGTVTITATAAPASATTYVTCSGGTYDPCYLNPSYCNCTYNYNYNCGSYGTSCGVYNYGYCGTSCGTLYNAYYGGACGAYNTGCTYGALGTYGYYGANNCYGACNLTNYNSCIPAPCTNIYGPILNCSTNYYGCCAGATSYTPSRVSILPGSNSVACGSATSITVTVADPNGLRAPDGTLVTFTTTLGYISSSDNTTGGTAVTSLTIPPGTTGSAKVTATSGGVSADTTVNVTCSSGAPAVVVQPLLPAIQQAIQAIRPTILPPSTGDAGLASD